MRFLAVVISLAGGVVLAQQAFAEPVVASCPARWTFGNQPQPLQWGFLWADTEHIDPEEGRVRKWPGGAVARWDMTTIKRRPLFLQCKYGDHAADELAIPLPEGVDACEVEWRGDYDQVVRASCTGPQGMAPSQIHPSEQQSAETEIKGLRLRRLPDKLQEAVETSGGTWALAPDRSHAEVGIGEERLTVMFSTLTGLSRELIVHGPPLADGEYKPFFAGIIRRFGFPLMHLVDKECGFAWDPKVEIQVEWRHTCGLRTGPVEQEMRLVDMKDPQSIRDREGGRRR